jgi:hypothetical protein
MRSEQNEHVAGVHMSDEFLAHYLDHNCLTKILCISKAGASQMQEKRHYGRLQKSLTRSKKQQTTNLKMKKILK